MDDLHQDNGTQTLKALGKPENKHLEELLAVLPASIVDVVFVQHPQIELYLANLLEGHITEPSDDLADDLRKIQIHQAAVMLLINILDRQREQFFNIANRFQAQIDELKSNIELERKANISVVRSA